jgi:hypothetical protein
MTGCAAQQPAWLWLVGCLAMPSDMGASHHQPQQNPTRQVDGLADRKSSFRRREDAVAVKAHGLLKQNPDGGAPAHAVTTPRIQPYQEIWAKPKAEWSAELHGFPWIA